MKGFTEHNRATLGPEENVKGQDVTLSPDGKTLTVGGRTFNVSITCMMLSEPGKELTEDGKRKDFLYVRGSWYDVGKLYNAVELQVDEMTNTDPVNALRFGVGAGIMPSAIVIEESGNIMDSRNDSLN